MGQTASDIDIARIASKPTADIMEAANRRYKENDLENALKLFSAVCSRFDATADKEQQRLFMQAFLLRGYILNTHGSYSLALDSYLQARGIAEKCRFKDALPNIYNKTGIIFAEINDLETALFYYRKALALADDQPSGDTRQLILNNLLYVYSLKGNADSTKYYYHKLARQSPNNGCSQYDNIFNLALVYEVDNKPDSALKHFHRAADFAARQMHSPLSQAAAHSSIAHIYSKRGMLDSAAHYFRLNEKIAADNGQNDLMLESLRQLADISSRMGRRQESLNYKERYLAISDSVFSREELNKIKNTQSLYELDNSATTIRSLNSLTVFQRYWIVALALMVILVSVMILLLYRQKSKLKKANNKQFQHNREQLKAEIYYKNKIHELDEQIERLEALQKPAAPPEEEEPEESTKSQGRKLMQTKQQRDRIVARILDVMEHTDDYCKTDYTIDNLANSIGSNSRYVSEVINEEMGMNFRSLLNEYRVKKSMIMLGDYEHYGHLTIKAISESVGYKSQSTFIAVFTKQTGLKPSLYQQLARGGGV